MKKILVIDDEEILIKTFSRLLEKSGYEVYAVSSGPDGIAMAQEEEFDLLMCDMRMPGMNGVDVVRQIHKSGVGKNKVVPIIFVTGFADEKLKQEAEKIQPLAYVHKPFDSADLLKIIKSGIGE